MFEQAVDTPVIWDAIALIMTTVMKVEHQLLPMLRYHGGVIGVFYRKLVV